MFGGMENRAKSNGQKSLSSFAHCLQVVKSCAATSWLNTLEYQLGAYAAWSRLLAQSV